MDFEIVKANREDMEEILELQYLAYQSEAALFGSRDIPPLKETLEEVMAEYDEGLVLKMMFGKKIIGSVRAREQDGTVYIGKLMVHPEHQKHGYGKNFSLKLRIIFPENAMNCLQVRGVRIIFVYINLSDIKNSTRRQ